MPTMTLMSSERDRAMPCEYETNADMRREMRLIQRGQNDRDPRTQERAKRVVDMMIYGAMMLLMPR